MAQNGRNPPAAKPAANVTPCCSAIPTSKQRLGYRCAKVASPVPSGIAAVTAQMRGSAAAAFNNTSEKTEV